VELKGCLFKFLNVLTYICLNVKPKQIECVLNVILLFKLFVINAINFANLEHLRKHNFLTNINQYQGSRAGR
jgi:hypothetical protein